jgi:hypothetical protein
MYFAIGELTADPEQLDDEELSEMLKLMRGRRRSIDGESPIAA